MKKRGRPKKPEILFKVEKRDDMSNKANKSEDEHDSDSSGKIREEDVKMVVIEETIKREEQMS